MFFLIKFAVKQYSVNIMDINEAYYKITKIINRALKINYHYCCTHFSQEISSSYEFYLSEDKLSSYSIQEYSNGFYLGEFRNGEREGYGCYVWNDGSLYLGEWSNSKKSGEGLYIGDSGYVYIGMYRNGEKHGHGCEHHSNGVEIEGDFEYGERITVMRASDSFTDNSVNKSYSKSTNTYKKESGCGSLVLIIIIIFIVLKCCS